MEKSRLEKRKKKRKRYIGASLSLFILLIVGSFIWIKWYIATRDISALQSPLPAATMIYDKNGKIASKISNSKMEAVKIEEIPTHFLEAVVATEDRRFYEHNGVDYHGVLRALVRNIQAGEWAEGGKYDYATAGEKRIFVK